MLHSLLFHAACLGVAVSLDSTNAVMLALLPDVTDFMCLDLATYKLQDSIHLHGYLYSHLEHKYPCKQILVQDSRAGQKW
jgi:hypothetical protein